MPFSRRGFLEFTALASQVGAAQTQQDPALRDGPASSEFHAVSLAGTCAFGELAGSAISASMKEAVAKAPRGACVHWGIPFEVGRPTVLQAATVFEQFRPFRAGWLVFLHTMDAEPLERDARGFIHPMRGEGRLAELAAEYIVVYSDGTEEATQIRRRHQIGAFRTLYGDTCFQAVAHIKPFPVRPLHEQSPNFYGWGGGEMRGRILDRGPWVNWVWAWKNPQPEKEIAALRLVPRSGCVIISGLAAGEAGTNPLQWRGRRKAILTLPEGLAFDFGVDHLGRRKQIQMDMGQIISVEPKRLYDAAKWTGAPEAPGRSTREVLVEYTCHPEARFHLWDGSIVRVSEEEAGAAHRLRNVPPATHRVRVRVLDAAARKPVPVRLHIHGASGEYLPPIDRARWANPSWFEDYAVEHLSLGRHISTYIPGETTVALPAGPVYLEIAKGFEIAPVRRVFTIDDATRDIEITLDRVLPWRERGWVTADTHVHFLSPQTARLEGSGEGVNVVNLLASQWGELLTNVGDFDGQTTWGSREAGGDGEWLVRVGTENRQRVMGHISLLGYRGDMIAPMCYGGPDEAALGDPVGALLMEWAEQCRRQGGLVVLPHFPHPRGENAACILESLVDGVEVSAGPARGIDPYSLSDYYRYLNCGYFVPAVGGTDKMSTDRAVGDVRTYSRLLAGQPLTYENWMASVRSGNTFVTCGPLVEFSAEGRPPGSRIDLRSGGGTVDIVWEAASCVLPMSSIELMVNGEVRESRSLDPRQDSGSWTVRINRSSWIAVMIRGIRSGREVIAAHSSPVMVHVEGSAFFSAVDALTMLDQIEGTLAYLDTVGSRADDEAHKRMRLRLTSAYNRLHTELHNRGHFHDHTHVTRHD